MINCLYCNKNQTQSFLTVKTPNILQASSFERAKLGKIIQQEIYLCPNCYLGFSQSNEIESYDYKEYHYLSPSSGLGHEQYKNFLNLLIKHSKPSDNILEIGCSDGHLLQQLKQKGFSSLSGIEPGPLADLALAKNLNVKKAYFTSGMYSPNSVSVIYLMHVLEHFSRPKEIIKEMIEILTDSGKIILEVPHFTAFEPEHVLYINLPFLFKLAEDFSLTFAEIYHDDNVLGVVLNKKKSSESKLISWENCLEIFDHQKKLALESEIKIKETMSKLEKFLISNNQDEIYWWGAGSSSIVYLNMLPSKVLDQCKIVVLDGDSKKQGLNIPMNMLEIRPKSLIANKNIKKIVVASSFFEEIKSSLKDQGTTYEEILNVF